MGEVVQLEIFGVSAVDPPWRDNRDAMEYPFLSLQKKRMKPITYRKGNIHLSIAADIRYSIATIWDWDLIIFAASHLNDAIEAGLKPSRPELTNGPFL
jgi:plasmid replication initiation protein